MLIIYEQGQSPNSEVAVLDLQQLFSPSLISIHDYYEATLTATQQIQSTEGIISFPVYFVFCIIFFK